MPRGGHNRKSAEEHIAEGTYRRDRHGAAPGLLQIAPKPAVGRRPSKRSQRRFIRSAADEHAWRNGCWFCEPLVEHVLAFFKSFLCHSKGQWAGKPFEPFAWQVEEIIGPLFGWVRSDGTRRYRRSYIEMPKKQGKSTLASGIGLYLLAGDEEPGAEVYSCGADRDQAKIVHTEALNMVDASPQLKDVLKVNRSTGNLYYPATKSWYRALSASPRGKHGLHIHGSLIDEIHVWTNEGHRDYFNALKYGYAARRQPLEFVITNAGDDMESIARKLHEKARAVLDGRLHDDTFFPLIYAADEKDDWTKKKTWQKANPALGTIVSWEGCKADIEDARQVPSNLHNLKRLRLGIWTTAESPWLDLSDWDQCEWEFDAKSCRGEPCYVGIDLAKTRDMTAAVCVFPDAEEETVWLLPYFWLPEAAVERLRNIVVDLETWIDEGLITVTPGDVCDYGWVDSDLRQLAEEFDVREIVYDPWHAEQLTQEFEQGAFDAAGKRIKQGTGIPRFAFRQTITNFASPTAEFERLVVAGKLVHNGNPVLRWQAGNVTVYQDNNGNMRPTKPKDYRKIDGIVASIMGLARVIKTDEERPPDYEGSGEIAFI